MPLKNYTTSIDAGKTCTEIEGILVRAGATRIHREFENGNLIAMAFTLRVTSANLEMEVPYMLPLRAKEVHRVLEKLYQRRRINRQYSTEEQAIRTGWRIIKDWVDAQVALIEIGCAKMEEVFLPQIHFIRK